MQTADCIRSCVLFSRLDDRALEELALLARGRACAKGRTLFSEGDDAAALFILAEGAIDLVKSSPEGKVQLVRSVNPGEIFAEAAMFAGEAYPATAIARKNSELRAIGKRDFVAFVKAHPNASLAIMGAMARLLRHLNALLADLSLGQVENRLAAFLLAKSRERNKATFSIGIAKRELALRLGTVPETLSRNLRKLKERGVIGVRGDFVTVRKPAALAALAGK